MHSQPRNTAGASTPLRIPLHGCARKQSSLSGLWLFPSWRMGQRGVSVRVPSPRAPREQIWPRNSPSPACTPRSLGKATWAIARSRAGHSRGSQVLQGTGWQRETPKLCSLRGWRQLRSRALILHTGISAELKSFKRWHAPPSFRGYSPWTRVS